MPARYPDYPYVEPLATNVSQEEMEATISDLLANHPGVGLKEGPLDGLCRALNVDIEYSSPRHEMMLDVPLHKRKGTDREHLLDAVRELRGMGFGVPQALGALLAANGDVVRAINELAGAS